MRASVFLAFLACELDRAANKEGPAGGGVEHLDETRVEVNLRGESADGDEAGVSNAQDGRYSFIKKAFIAVRCFLQDQDIATRSFGRTDLHTHTA